MVHGAVVCGRKECGSLRWAVGLGGNLMDSAEFQDDLSDH